MKRCLIHSVRPAGLIVGGHPCPTSGEIAGRDIPADGRYYLTTFGGGADTQSMSCGGIADGTWYYLADSWRFGCGTKIQITNPTNGRSCVAQVADVGPNICVEQAAGLPVIDASPLVSRLLFGGDSSGWADRRLVIANRVDPSTPLGPTNASAAPSVPGSGSILGIASVTLGAYLLWRALSNPRSRAV